MRTKHEELRSSQINKSWNHSYPHAYLVPSQNIVIKVEKVHDNHYVAHFPDGAEKVNKKTVSGWTCQGRWIETATVAQLVLQ
ncbi:MAG: hypothetical protein ACJ76H_14715 [Bacteriovoracaceae bacterium]